jgi:DNA-binding winged helix-turn-helix (wHTH) protein
VLHFGECAFDAERRLVFCSSNEVHLSRKAFDLLKILIDCQPRLVTKSELQDRLWPSTFVVDGNLSNLVAEVRRALHDDAHQPRYIRTVHGLGYSFCGSVAADGGPPTLPVVEFWLQLEGDRLPLPRGDHLIGRSPSSVVPIDDRTISRRHACIRVDDEATIVDLGSRNGTYLKGMRIKAPSILRHGDFLRIGSLTITFLVSRHSVATADHDMETADSQDPERIDEPATPGRAES